MKLQQKSQIIPIGIVLCLYFLLMGLTNHYILTPQFFARSGQPLGGPYAQQHLLYRQAQLWIYFSATLWLLVRWSATTLLLYTTLYISGQFASWFSLFRAVATAELVFVFSGAVKACWFWAAYPTGTLLVWHRFYPLSAMCWFPDVPADWVYPLASLNLFEPAYLFVLAAGICPLTHAGFGSTLRLVALSYVPALFLWLCCACFCAVLLFPDHA